jgi:Lecithin retinol acyltransferase
VLTPGTHIRVHRQLRYVGLPYWHHAIYVDDSEVIEFAGGDLWNSAMTQVRPVSLVSFAQGGPVTAVSHPKNWAGLAYSPMLPPEQVVDRAGWLVHNQPPPYHLGYRNCESIAVWCATGDFESFQVKGFMFGKSIMTLPALALMKKRPSIGEPLAIAGIVVSLITAVPYIHSRALFNHTRLYPGVGNWIP